LRQHAGPIFIWGVSARDLANRKCETVNPVLIVHPDAIKLHRDCASTGPDCENPGRVA
jgi:hypothetical protein